MLLNLHNFISCILYYIINYLKKKISVCSYLVHHTKSVIIGDLYQSEISKYFHENLVPSIPQEIRERIFKMENDLHEILGGKILHWKSFVQDYILSRGKLTSKFFFFCNFFI
jgi:hypothetical protein